MKGTILQSRLMSWITGLFVKKSDVVDNLTSQETQKPLSAAQGKVLEEHIQQSTANISTLKSGETTIGNIICAGYNTGSGNYFAFFVPINAKGLTPISASAHSDTVIFAHTGRIQFSSQPTITVMSSMDNGVLLQVTYPSTQTPNICGTIYVIGLKIVCQ